MRDLNKMAESGQKKIQANTKRDLHMDEIQLLLEETKQNGAEGFIELISKVYAAGFEEGYRSRKAEEKKIERLSH